MVCWDLSVLRSVEKPQSGILCFPTPLDQAALQPIRDRLLPVRRQTALRIAYRKRQETMHIRSHPFCILGIQYNSSYLKQDIRPDIFTIILQTSG
jgi:hypothetical protein